MSNYICEHCGTAILEGPGGTYVTECEHWPLKLETGVMVWNSRTKEPYPWRFAVYYCGVRHDYGGIPNYCETFRSALARARWRLEWLRRGTYHKHYEPVYSNSFEAFRDRLPDKVDGQDDETLPF